MANVGSSGGANISSLGGSGGGGGSGTVTSVGLSDGSSTPIFTISGSPVTTSGTLTETLKTQAANTIFAGPSTGADAQPTFRALVAADIPSSALTVVSKTSADSPYTIAAGVGLVLVDTSGGAVTVNLPAATGTGRQIKIKYTDSGAVNAITVARAGSDTIQDVSASLTSVTLNTQGEEFNIVDAASAVWQVTEKRIPSVWTSFTPTGLWTTNVTYTGFWRRVGDTMEINGKIAASGAPGQNGNLSITLPFSKTINTSKITALQFSTPFGDVNIQSSGDTNDFPGRMSYNDTTSVVCLQIVSNNTSSTNMNAGITKTSPQAIGSGDSVSFKFSVPITGWNG